MELGRLFDVSAQDGRDSVFMPWLGHLGYLEVIYQLSETRKMDCNTVEHAQTSNRYQHGDISDVCFEANMTN